MLISQIKTAATRAEDQALRVVMPAEPEGLAGKEGVLLTGLRGKGWPASGRRCSRGFECPVRGSTFQAEIPQSSLAIRTPPTRQSRPQSTLLLLSSVTPTLLLALHATLVQLNQQLQAERNLAYGSGASSATPCLTPMAPARYHGCTRWPSTSRMAPPLTQRTSP